MAGLLAVANDSGRIVGEPETIPKRASRKSGGWPTRPRFHVSLRDRGGLPFAEQRVRSMVFRS